MSRIARTKHSQTDWNVDRDNPDDDNLPKRLDVAERGVAHPALSPDSPSAAANLVPLDHGLYALEIGESRSLEGQLSGLPVPLIQVSAPLCGQARSVEIIDMSGGGGEKWFGCAGGTAIVKAPPGGAHVLVTVYSLPAQVIPVPQIEVRRLDRSPPKRDPGRPDLAAEPEEVGTEIVLHIERLGDQRFSGRGWAGDRGKKLRIEAFSVRPVNTLLARDIEFKALGPNRRETPWVTDAKLCGTRGQGLPLTGFAVRLAAHAGGQFDVVYEGAFFKSGIVGPNRNGELCIPSIADDPLEAISVRLIRQAAE